ncbi:MAG: c-type cytochrome [Trueperaceae bacterium]
MRRFYVLLFVAVGMGMLLAAAQETDTPSIEAAEHDQLGKYLTDSEGRALYLFRNDERGGPSTCYDGCAENWPPVVFEGSLRAGEGVAESLLGTVERDDGSLQATYYGWPLYYFARDEAPGDTNGQGAGDVWFLVSPYGEAVEPRDEATAAGDEGGKPAAAEGVDTEDVTQDEGAERDEAAAEPDDEGGKPAAAKGVDTEDVTQDEAGEKAEPTEEEGDGADGAETEEIPSDVMAQGQSVYRANCATCHGAEGGGGSGPALAGNSRLGNESRVLNQILNGGSFMPPFGGQLSDEEVAAVATHIRNSWGNDFGLTTAEEVSEAR